MKTRQNSYQEPKTNNQNTNTRNQRGSSPSDTSGPRARADAPAPARPLPGPAGDAPPPAHRKHRLPVTFRVSRFKPCVHHSPPSTSSPYSSPLAPNPNRNPNPCSSAAPPPPYSLKRGLGFWQLTFNGQSAIFRHEIGASYVAALLLNPPPRPIHGLDLATRMAAAEGRPCALTEIIDPRTGQVITLEADARIQERSPELNNAVLMRRVLQEQERLEAFLEDEEQPEQLKAEVQRELIALYDFEKHSGKKIRDGAQRAVRAVTMAIKRFHRRLATALDTEGKPHPVLCSFAKHIHDHLLIPSGRACGHGGFRDRSSLAGRFTYQPPPGVTWSAGS